MTIDIMNEYIEITKKQIREYMKLVFEEQFNSNYCNIFIERYIQIRYFNYYENNIETTRRNVLDHLKQIGEEIIINNIKDRELIELMRMFFYYVLYFDNVTYYKDLRNKITQIGKMKCKKIGKELNAEELYNKMDSYIKHKESIMNDFASDEFFLKISKYPNKYNVFRVNLKYKNIKFPMEYSEFAINRAYQMGIVNEDKLIIEYYLTVLQILKDIIKQNFKRKYIVEFAPTLLKKTKKIKRVLNIIKNEAIQDRVSLKIKYEKFLENKQEIYELMQEGYKIAVILDNSFVPEFKNIESLQIFEFVIINQGLKYYEDIMEKHGNLHNIIEI